VFYSKQPSPARIKNTPGQDRQTEGWTDKQQFSGLVILHYCNLRVLQYLIFVVFYMIKTHSNDGFYRATQLC